MRRRLTGVLSGLLLTCAVGVQAATQTIATFADPVAAPPPFLFTYSDTTANGTVDGTLSGGYSGTGLTLIFPFLGFAAHQDVTFTITDTLASPVLGDPNGTRFLPAGGGLGTLTFDDAGVTIMTATFNQLHRTTGVAGATDTLAGELVALTVPGALPITDPETFAFSFANVTGDVAAALAGDIATVDATAAFTSSGTPVAESGTLLLLGTGLIGLALIGRCWNKEPLC